MEDTILRQRPVDSLANAVRCIADQGGLIVTELVGQVDDDLLPLLKVFDLRADGFNCASAVRARDGIRVRELQPEASLDGRH